LRNRLTFLNQATIRPTALAIDVQLPDGMAFSGANLPVDVSGGHVHWSGVPGRRLVLEVRFERPWPHRVWQDAVDVLTRPLLRIP
jgi:hypothetical protein